MEEISPVLIKFPYKYRLWINYRSILVVKYKLSIQFEANLLYNGRYIHLENVFAFPSLTISKIRLSIISVSFSSKTMHFFYCNDQIRNGRFVIYKGANPYRNSFIVLSIEVGYVEWAQRCIQHSFYVQKKKSLR